MERILDENEKIRRAEEIYYRRNNKNVSIKEKEEKKIKGNLKNKIFLQLLIMLNISIIVFAIQNKDFIFTTEFLETIENYNTEINFKVTEYLKGILQEDDQTEDNSQNEIVENVEQNEETSENETKEQNEETSQEIGSSSLSEMDLDVQNLKAAYSFIKPISGVVSSGFGSRTSEYQKVTGYHTGIDIAKEKGSVIKASMGGIVDLVSSEGDYGKHIKIRCNNVTTLYAHCSKIYVKEGQIVAQGQEIAEVGSTGNSTGPHLHFEIRIDDRFIDPSRIIDF